MRIASIIMFVLLLLCVAVQWNDPDGWLWMLIYGYGTVVTWFAIQKRYSVAALIGAIGYLLGALYWMPKEMVEHPSNLFLDLRMHEKGVEEVREDVGLYICAVWMLVLSVAWWRNRKSSGTAPVAEPGKEQAA